jgi:hypothetical protein
MSKIRSMMRSDFQRAFISPTFFVSVLSITLLQFFIIYSTQEKVSSTLYIYYFVDANHTIGNLELVLGVIPYALSFCFDWKNYFIRPLVIRGTLKGYAISKFIMCVLSSTIALILGNVIFILLIRTKVPFVPTDVIYITEYIESITSGAFAVIAQQGHYFSYILMNLISTSLLGGLLSGIALFISTKLTNVFITVFSPLIFYYFLVNISARFNLLEYFDIENIYSPFFNLGGITITFIYQLIFFVIVNIIVCMLFVKSIYRRVNNG